jgi:hypothetical protein
MGRFAVVTIQHRLTPSETQGEFGFVGVVLDAELLRILAHDGFHCVPQLEVLPAFDQTLTTTLPI